MIAMVTTDCHERTCMFSIASEVRRIADAKTGPHETDAGKHIGARAILIGYQRAR